MFFRRDPAKLRHIRGLLRAGAYLGCLGIALGACQLRAAHAEITSRTVILGREMAALANPAQHDVYKVTLNGQAMYLASTVSHDTAATILGRYDAHCRTNAAQPAADWLTIAKEHKERPDAKRPPAPALPDGVLRGGDEDEGTVVCFTRGERSKPTLREAFGTLVATGELGAVGNLRYAYARKTENGNTLVLTAWTENRFQLDALVPPADGEAAGADFPEVPRVPDAQRMFSARVEDTPFGVNVYRSKAGSPAVVAYYDGEMKRRGWRGIDPELARWGGASNDPAHPIGRLYEKDGVVLTLVASVDGTGSRAALGLAGVGAAEERPR